jgi:hypothetical protein
VGISPVANSTAKYRNWSMPSLAKFRNVPEPLIMASRFPGYQDLILYAALLSQGPATTPLLRISSPRPLIILWGDDITLAKCGSQVVACLSLIPYHGRSRKPMFFTHWGL